MRKKNMIKRKKILGKIMEVHILFLFCVHKMVNISAETFAKNCINSIKH